MLSCWNAYLVLPIYPIYSFHIKSITFSQVMILDSSLCTNIEFPAPAEKWD